MDRAARTLVEVMEVIQTLRSPEGCPWDRKQTPAMVKNYITEELYELLDAIDGDDAAHVAEETGDVLFLLLFLARMYEEQGAFSLADSLERIRDKMIHRHPHVFGTVQVDSAEQVVANWQKLKVQEGKKPKESLLDGLPSSMPALSRACALTRKAARVGFDWPDTAGVFAKIREELAELEAEIAHARQERIKDEVGDILFSVVNLPAISTWSPRRPCASRMKSSKTASATSSTGSNSRAAHRRTRPLRKWMCYGRKQRKDDTDHQDVITHFLKVGGY